jgi:tRNA(Ile)-lysidine synthase
MTQAVVALRNAVKPFLEKLEAGDVVLVAVSGGADSLALAYAVFAESKPLAIKVVAVTVDHQLQDKSAEQAEKVARQLTDMGYEKVFIEKVTVKKEAGLEAGARTARYQALDLCAEKSGAVQIFLGHTRDDQAETVLLGLARGSGARSLSGMAPINGKYVRPFLQITRQETEQACKDLNLDFWNDPHNTDSEFTRVKVRQEILPLMESKLGPGISAALARSAGLLRDDADALDAIAASEISDLNLREMDCDHLAALPRAIRTRIVRRALYAAGAPEGSITADHVSAIEALVTSWRGQGALDLPGGVKVERISGRLSLLAQPTQP